MGLGQRERGATNRWVAAGLPVAVLVVALSPSAVALPRLAIAGAVWLVALPVTLGLARALRDACEHRRLVPVEVRDR